MVKANNKMRGYVMTVVGFLMILFNAISYILSDNTSPIVGILGLLFVAVGLNWTKKKE